MLVVVAEQFCCYLLQIYISYMVGVIYASYTTTCKVLIILETLC